MQKRVLSDMSIGLRILSVKESSKGGGDAIRSLSLGFGLSELKMDAPSSIYSPFPSGS